MADSTAPAACSSGSSLYESTSNELDISSSDESLSSNEEESSSSISDIPAEKNLKLYDTSLILCIDSIILNKFMRIIRW